jgi:hypothetical protein
MDQVTTTLSKQDPGQHRIPMAWSSLLDGSSRASSGAGYADDRQAPKPTFGSLFALCAQDHHAWNLGLTGPRIAGSAAVAEGFGRLIRRAGFRKTRRAHHHLVDPAHRRPRHASIGGRSDHTELRRRRRAILAVFSRRTLRTLRAGRPVRTGEAGLAFIAFIALVAFRAGAARHGQRDQQAAGDRQRLLHLQTACGYGLINVGGNRLFRAGQGIGQGIMPCPRGRSASAR